MGSRLPDFFEFPFKMPNKIKLTYFNARGRAEVSRLMLAHKGVDYEDCRITREQWPELKPKTPFGGIPLLQYNGLELAQPMTIARFLARELNLAGKTRCEEAQVDMVVDCIVDLFAALVKVTFEKDETKKAELAEKMQKEIVPTAMANLEKILAKNGGKHMVGNDVTWADFEVANFFQIVLNAHGEKAFGANKNLLALTKKVMEMPNVKAWVEKRPKTDI